MMMCLWFPFWSSWMWCVRGVRCVRCVWCVFPLHHPLITDTHCWLSCSRTLKAEPRVCSSQRRTWSWAAPTCSQSSTPTPTCVWAKKYPPGASTFNLRLGLLCKKWRTGWRERGKIPYDYLLLSRPQLVFPVSLFVFGRFVCLFVCFPLQGLG